VEWFGFDIADGNMIDGVYRRFISNHSIKDESR
jgi:hypothetical protein